MTKIITSFFTKFSVPQTGLSPTVRIWLLDPLVPATNTLVVNNDPLVEIGDGFYRYNFSTYDPIQNYVIRVDGGATLPDNERYSTASNESFSDDVAKSVWDEPALSHVAAGTMGLLESQIKADTTSISISMTSAISLITTLVKYGKNRTRIDTTANTLTIYDDNGITPLKVFDLKDEAGAPSVLNVAERNPQ